MKFILTMANIAYLLFYIYLKISLFIIDSQVFMTIQDHQSSNANIYIFSIFNDKYNIYIYIAINLQQLCVIYLYNYSFQ